MRHLTVLLPVLLAAVAHGQDAKDDLSSAFGPPPAAKVFEPEHNVLAPPLPIDVNAELRATFERDLADAQKSLESGDAAAAREKLTMVELSAIGLGGPERVRVHQLQRAVATKLDDRAALSAANEKWLAACGPNDVAACRASALAAMAAYDPTRVEKIRAADDCLIAAEKGAAKRLPGCLDSALALYKKAEDTLMVARIQLLRALALVNGGQTGAAKKALAQLSGLVDDRSATVRRAALETHSRLELAAGAVEAALKDAILASEAWASTLPPARRAWARSPMVDTACAEYEKTRGAGACRKLEKKLLGGDYVFHDFSDEQLGERLITHDKLVAVNAHYGVLIQNCLAAEIRTLEDRAAVTYRVKWLVLSDGHVDNFHSESTEQDQSHFVQCLREHFGYWRYPRHEGDPQRIEQSFNLKSTTRSFEETGQ